MPKKRRKSVALEHFTPVSARYEQRTIRRMRCFDRLPEVVRTALRESDYDTHDPVELVQFTQMRHNNPQAIAEQVRVSDANRRAQWKASLPAVQRRESRKWR